MPVVLQLIESADPLATTLHIQEPLTSPYQACGAPSNTLHTQGHLNPPHRVRGLLSNNVHSKNPHPFT